MKRAIVCLVLAGFIVTVTSALALAGPNANAKIQLHVGAKVAKNICQAGQKACNAIVTAGGLYPPTPYYTYLVVTDYDTGIGVAGGQCGIAYTGGVTVFTWTLCASLQFPSDPPDAWPASGGGNLWTWDALSTDPLVGCQKSGLAAVAGYFYMGAYSPGGTMSVTKRPSDNAAKVADCSASEELVCGPGDTGAPCTGVSHLGTAAFNASSTGGYNPCGLVTPTQQTSWGAIKGIYR
jgi:hypothetical protein